jgi:hypothetical protein
MMATPDPDAKDREPPSSDPPTDERADAEPASDERAPRHPDLQADLHERADGAHAEQIIDEANLRADPDPPD